MPFRMNGDILAEAQRHKFPAGVKEAILVVRLFQPLSKDARRLLRLPHRHVHPLQAAHEALTVGLPRRRLYVDFDIHFSARLEECLIFLSLTSIMSENMEKRAEAEE